MTINPRLIKASLQAIDPIADTVVGHFYALLFMIDPALRDLFPVSMAAQRDRLLQALLHIGRNADDLSGLTPFLEQLGRDHRKYGVRPEHYQSVGTALMTALARYTREQWTAELAESWGEAYQIAATVMLQAAHAADAEIPSTWIAEVTAHERRGIDVAVLTLAPDQPFPYRAGQYLSIQTPMWPRVWRHYSIANAPRADQTLEIHVRAVPAGWVSNALVHHTRVGDRIVLGPAMGSMLLPGDSTLPALAIGGGTGISPIKALIEEMADQRYPRTMRVFFGVRRLNDLYDLDALTRLAFQHSWLAVAPVVSDETMYPGLRGPVVQTALTLGPWYGHDVFLAGPPAMLQTGLSALNQTGIARSSIRFDPCFAP
jgi:NAD(P)H-flavin reductase/hemoglobin-like flavoprotein